jgi:hypothetical protein
VTNWPGAGAAVACGSLRHDPELVAAGRHLGTAFGHYLVWLGQQGAAAGARRAYFLSREGAWFARHYEGLRRHHPEGAAWPEPVPLAVSRQSTFLPSLPRISPEAIAPLLAQYRQASARTVLGSLGLSCGEGAAPPGDIAPGLPLDASWSAPGVAAQVLAHPQIAAELADRHAGQRTALLRYLRENGVDEGREVLVADIGWRGSIQDNLARLLPDRRFTGCYLGVQPFLAPQPQNATKHGFIAGAESPPRLQRRLRFVAPMEFAASDDTPSAIAYREEGGRVRAMQDRLAVIPAETPGFAALQDGIRQGIAELARLRSPSPELARRIVLDVLERPSVALARLFFQAWRDDRFGAGTLRRGAPRLEATLVLRALASTAARRSLGLRLAESGWPWGLLVRDLPWAAPALRAAILVLDPRL